MQWATSKLQLQFPNLPFFYAFLMSFAGLSPTLSLSLIEQLSMTNEKCKCSHLTRTKRIGDVEEKLIVPLDLYIPEKAER